MKSFNNHNCCYNLVLLFIDSSDPGRAHISHELGYNRHCVCRKCGIIYKSANLSETDLSSAVVN